jgi:hypothetical protein
METRRDRKRDLADHGAKTKHDRRKMLGRIKVKGEEEVGLRRERKGERRCV